MASSEPALYREDDGENLPRAEILHGRRGLNFGEASIETWKSGVGWNVHGRQVERGCNLF